MEIEVVAIGNEILAGITVNTNAAEIGHALFKEDYRVGRQTTLPDDFASLKQGLEESLQRNRVVITTGGLGPTCDDITRQVAAELFDSEFRYDEDVAQELKRRYGNYQISLENQATVPSKAILLKNEVGTAPGMVFSSSKSTLIMMPGIPREMRPMLANEAIPYILKHFPLEQRSVSRCVHFFGLSESAVDPELRLLQKKYPEVEFGIYPAGTLSIYASVKTSDEETGLAYLKPILKELTTHFSRHHYESLSGKIEEAVHNLFIKKGWTLSIAESCTGGSIASRLTKIPGASQYFLGSIVAYSNELKQKVLGVPEELIRIKGAVSEEVVAAMATGAISLTNSDYSIAVSGIAGPSGGTEQKPVGTVWIAIAKKEHTPHVRKFQMLGPREWIIERSVIAILGELLESSQGFQP